MIERNNNETMHYLMYCCIGALVHTTLFVRLGLG